MKTKTIKQLLCCLLAALFVLCCFPPRSLAEGQGDAVVFSTFEELCGFCTQAADHMGKALICEEADLLISENLEIPSGMSVTFRSFTVPKGVTLTVMKDAELMTFALTIQGELINRGSVFQGDLTDGEDSSDIKIAALVPGHIDNKGEMTLTDVYGKRNIRWLGSHFTMIETDHYGKYPETDTKEPEPQPTAFPTDEPDPYPEPPAEARERVLEILDALEVYLPRLAFFFVLFCVGMVLKVGIVEKKQTKAPGRSPSSSKARRGGASVGTDSPGQQRMDSLHAVPGEDHFERDRRNRIAQLDVWLKNGLIDRKEYSELKKRYSR